MPRCARRSEDLPGFKNLAKQLLMDNVAVALISLTQSVGELPQRGQRRCACHANRSYRELVNRVTGRTALRVWNPAQGWSNMLGEVLQNLRVHIHAHAGWDGNEQAVCFHHRWIRFELLNEHVRFIGVGAAKDGSADRKSTRLNSS